MDFPGPSSLLKSLAIALLWATSALCAATTPAPTSAGGRPEIHVLFVGNSLIYTNNLPGLVRALAAAQPAGPRIVSETYVAPGGTIAERWEDGAVAAALASRPWDAIVLQERGGMLACLADHDLRQHPLCRASERAHKDFAELAASRGTRTLLLATWGLDESSQSQMDRAITRLASRIEPGDAAATVVPAGSTLRLFASRHSQLGTFPDGIHPSTQASLIMAAQLYRALTGHDAQAVDVVIDFPLLPVNTPINPGIALERQPQIAGDGELLLVKAATIAPLLQAATP